MKRLALVALLLASSSLVAAPAPLPKPQRKAERPARQAGARATLADLILDSAEPACGLLLLAPKPVLQES